MTRWAYDCADCGVHVVTLGCGDVLPSMQCATCRWISENVLPEDEAAVRARLGVPLQPTE
jgi:hypothetical protein